VERRRRIITRALPLALLAIASFVVGAATGVRTPPEKASAERFAEAWARQDFGAMQAELNPASRHAYPVKRLRNAYLDAEETATARTFDPGQPSDPHGGVVTLPVVANTAAFGNLAGDVKLPYSDGGIAWASYLTFPGLAPGEHLVNNISLAERAPILARDGTPLAEGPAEARSSPLGSAAIDVTGEVGQAPAENQQQLAMQGFPAGTPVGISGLEQAFNSRLAGQPGGELLAAQKGTGSRVLAHSKPKPGLPVKTTIDPTLQQAAVNGLAGRAGGVTVLDARDGSVRALAGSAFSAPQPPGSTFKMITTTAALQKGVVSLDDTFPILNGINVGGRFIDNAHQEYCGGTFVQAFADSCNSVFTPLGPKIGNDLLVKTAERYGFNAEPSLYNAAATAAVDPPKPSIPTNVGSDLDLAVSAIGQGQVLATPLELASVAQTISQGGIRSPTPIVRQKKLRSNAKPVRVSSKKIAGKLRYLMEGVVNSGTGIAAQLPGVQVAGKTGTAELGPKPGAPAPAPGQTAEQAVDAWFAAFAPATKPRLAVAVLLVDASADGGTVAAPIAHDILATGLGLG